MAANSIAKLSVLITGDSSGLSRAAQQSDGIIRQFGSSVDRSGRFTAQLGVAVARTSGAFGPFGRAVGSVAGQAGAMGALAGAVVGIGAAAAAAAFKLTSMADAARDARIEIKRAYEEAVAERDGTKPKATEKTNKELFADIKEQFSDFGELAGLTFKPFLSGVASLTKDFKELVFGTEVTKALDKEKASVKGLGEETKKITEENRKRAEEASRAAEKAQRDAEQAIERLRQRGVSLTESLRTPIEKYKDALKEAAELAAKGFIDAQTLQRAADAAADEYRRAVEMKKDASSFSVNAGGALQRGSVAEYSARVKADQEQQQIAKAQLEEERMQSKTQGEMLAALKQIASQPGGQALKVMRLN